MSSNRAVIVGAGISGLTAAAFLAKAGVAPLLLERSDRIGGLVQSFEIEGFTFDAGARAFENAGIIFPMLQSLGLELPVVHNPVMLAVEGEKVSLGTKDSIADYEAMLQKLYPENRAEIKKIISVIRRVMADLDVIYGIDNPLFAENMKDLTYLKSTLLPWFKDYLKSLGTIKKLSAPVVEYLRDFTDNASLIDIITQHFFKGTPAFFALSYFGLYLDYKYPLGGTGELSRLLADYVVAQGGNLQTEAEVTQVDPKTQTLTLKDGSSVNYEQLIWAADMATFYRLLTELPNRQAKRQRILTEESFAADSVLTWFLATDFTPKAIASLSGAHSFYTPSVKGIHGLSNWRDLQTKEALIDWVKQYLELTTYEISVPVLRDPTLAPEGQTGLIVSTLLDYDLVRRFSDLGIYEEFKSLTERKMLEVLGRDFYPGLCDKRLFSFCATPQTIESRTGNKQGGLNGWSFCNSEVPAEHRFTKMMKATKNPVPNVTQCGQWTFSPAGVPTCILTGKLAADAVLKEL